MNISTESGSPSPWCCELCDFVWFSSYFEFQKHHLNHIRQPVVRLHKLSSKLVAKIQAKGYIFTEPERSALAEYIPPLKLSCIEQKGVKHFQVIKEEVDLNLYSPSSPIGHYFNKVNPNTVLRTFNTFSDVEAQQLLERFGAKISVSRKGKTPSRPLQGNGNGDGKKNSTVSKPDVSTENVLERLSGIGGISISPKSKSSLNDDSGSQNSFKISISSKQKSIDLDQLKKLKDQDGENDKKKFDKNKILEKLSGSGLISIASVSQGKANREEGRDSPKANTDPCRLGESQEVLERLGLDPNQIPAKPKPDSTSENSDSRSSDDQINSTEEGTGKVANENSSEGGEQRKFVRVKNSTYSKKNHRPERQLSLEKSSEERAITPGETKDTPGETKEKVETRESGFDILERLTDDLNNTVGSTKSGGNLYLTGNNSENSNPDTMEGPLLSTNSDPEEFNSQPNVSQTDQVTSATPDFSGNNEADSQEPTRDCALLLTPPSSSGQEGESSDFGTATSHQSESFSEPNTGSEEGSEMVENAAAFSSLNEDQSGDDREHSSSFWSDIPNSTDGADEPQQDPLLTTDSPVNNGEGLNQNFLQNFLSDPQPPSNNIVSENSEFMSLDRLAQTQHQQPPFDMGTTEANTPMEQLSQQVQRMPNPPPQISVISQHHMQAPQPPQLHTGVPMSPQHMSPQQPNSYDALGHMQPPMPPPLYQGYNMFNQGFPPQTQPQMPRPPMLQQRPHIQPRSFQSLAAPPLPPPPRPRIPKRNSLRSPLHDMAPPKMRRTDPLQARPQMPNPTAKLPSGITVTAPKKAIEANKVANLLASRGITITPSASRQTNQAARPQQRNNNSSPMFNISSAVSITSSGQNRNNGGFAVPNARRNPPIVNHNLDRPERCTTVDLTQDDEGVQLPRSRMSLERYPCNRCGKVFSSSATLDSHMSLHRNLPFKCDKCAAHYPTLALLQNHKATFHKTKQFAPDLAIPIVDLNHPGARDQLLKCGVLNFIPLSQLQSNKSGYFGIPIIQLDKAKEKAVSNLKTLGAGNILVLGKMRALAPLPNV